MLVRYEFTDPDDPGQTPLEMLQVGEDFLLRVYIQDTRESEATGVLQAYFDVFYDLDQRHLVSVDGPVSHEDSEYDRNPFGDTSTYGLIHDAGGLNNTDRLPEEFPSEEYLLFSVPFRADAAGLLELTTNTSTFSPRSTLFYKSPVAVQLGAIHFENTSIEIVAAAINVTPTSGLFTTEAGGTADFQVSLTKAPTANVTIGLSSSNPGEGTLSHSSLTFTPGDWSTPKTVTVTGVDDLADDGDVAYSIITTAATSGDPAYNGQNAPDVSLVNLDNDAAGIQVTPTSGTTSESGGTATFAVVLTSRPAANVTVNLASSDTTEGTVSPAGLTFTPSNWNTAKNLTVTGVDDNVVDGDVDYTIITAPAVSTDPNYGGLNAIDVVVTNTDNDTASIVVSPTLGLVTTEAGGTAAFTIVLGSQPAADVTIGLSSSDASEGTVSPSSVTFTSSNWNSPRTVTVTGVDDDAIDGDVDYAIVTAPATSSDPNYNGLNAADVAVTNEDDDVPGIVVTPTSGLETSEDGTTATFTIVLATQPAADVTIDLSSSDVSEGTVSPSSVAFTSSTWNSPRAVTVTGVNDNLADGDVAYTIITAAATSSDPAYNGLNAADVSVTNEDNDVPGIVVSPTSGLETSEDGQAATFTIVLATQPAADVTIGLSSSDTSEGTVSPQSVTFTTADWNSPRTVTVTGVEDDEIDGDAAYTIITAAATSNDGGYSGLDADDVAVTNDDNDVAAVIVTPTAGLTTTEGGGTAEFIIRLASRPAAAVTIPLVSSDPEEGLPGAQSVVLDAGNWTTGVAVTVTGVDDQLVDGGQAYTIQTGDPTSDDPNYDALGADDVDDVTLTNVDDDAPAVIVTPTSGLTTSEGGGTAAFVVRLNKEPQASVTIPLVSTDTAEGTLAVGSVTLDSSNWSEGVTVTVTGADDPVVDGNRAYTIATGDPTSSDVDFNDLTAGDVPDVSLVNADDDVATLTLAPLVNSTTEAAGGTLTFQVTLTGEVAGGFTVAYATGDGTAALADGDYADNDGSLVFTGTSGQSHTITVVINDDAAVEAAETLTVTLGALSNIDPSAAARIAVSGSPATGTIVDDDTATLTITDVSMAEGTGGTTSDFVFNVVLSHAVQGGFRVAYSTSDGEATAADGDYADDEGTIPFTGTAGEARSITVSVQRDAKVERDETFRVALGSLSELVDASMAARITVDADPAVGTIENDDTATISFASAASTAIEAAGSHIVLVRLSVAGGGTLGEAVTLSVADLLTGTATAADYSLDTTSVTFAAGSADGATRNVTLTTVVDSEDETAETVDLGLGVIGDGIGGAVALGSPQAHTVTITDDPMTAVISGAVWTDTNASGQRDQGEATLPGVRITLSGTDVGGRTIEITTWTGDDGTYRFANLPGGTYSVFETQPAAFHDGPESLGTASGQQGNDQFTGIVLAPAQEGQGYDFGEWGLKAQYISRRMFLASSPPASQMLRQVIAAAEQQEGNASEAKAILQNTPVEVRRIDSAVTVTGTAAKDVVTFVPAGSKLAADDSRHTVEANGMTWTFDAAQVDSFMFLGGDGTDELELHDSAASDALEAVADTVTFSSGDFRLEAIAFELALAISESGGDDDATDEATDLVLQLEGPWNA